MGNEVSAVVDSEMAQSVEKSGQKLECPVFSEIEVQNVYKEWLKRDSNSEANGGLREENKIPLGLRNKPMEGQNKPLSTHRETSTIPKGDTESTWTYPSPQMFFNGWILFLMDTFRFKLFQH